MPGSILPGWHLPNGSQLAGFVGTIAFHSVAISINPPEPGYRVKQDPRRVLWYTEGRNTTACTRISFACTVFLYSYPLSPTPPQAFLFHLFSCLFSRPFYLHTQSLRENQVYVPLLADDVSVR